MIRFAPSRTTLTATLTLALTAVLTACGGGGGGDESPSVVNPTSSVLQGRWASAGIEPAYTAIAVPASSGANTPVVDTIWGLAQDGSALYKLQTNGAAGAAGTVTGKRYTLGTSAVAVVTPGSYSISTTLGTQLTLQSALGEPVSFTRSDAMSAALRADQANGRWRAVLGSIEVNWTVQSAGSTNNLSGTSTSGCTYSGTSAVVASQSLYRVDFSENCAGTVQAYVGVATMTSDDSRLTVVATSADESRGVALLFARQP